MTEYKVGDKVRVEIEGEVASSTILDGRPVIVMKSEGKYVGRVSLNAPNDAVKITKIVEVPTKPGAVVYPYYPGTHFILTRNEYGAWTDYAGKHYTQDTLTLFLEKGTHYVAFEGVEA